MHANPEAELDLRDLLRVLRRRWMLILIMPLVAAVTAGVASYLILTPVYQASTTMWVIKEGSEQLSLQDIQFNRNLTRTYAEIAKSRAVMADVISQLELTKLTVAQLQQKLTVTTVRDTEILSFAMQDEDPEMAALLANAVAASFQAQVRTFMKIDNVAVVDPALVPRSPIKPRPLMNVALATVLGAMAAVGLAFLLEFLDTSLKTPEDVTRRLGLPVLGVIPDIKPTQQAQAAPVRGRRTKR